MSALETTGLTSTAIELAGNQRLELQRGDGEDVLTISAPDGRLRLTIRLTPRGAELELSGVALAIRASGDLAIEANQLALRGRDGLALESGGDAAIRVAGDLTSEAAAHLVTATRGDVRLTANDDVKLAAERIRLNC